jgi:hypothetical protein
VKQQIMPFKKNEIAQMAAVVAGILVIGLAIVFAEKELDPSQQQKPAVPTPQEIVRGVNDTCNLIVGDATKVHIACNLNWPVYGHIDYPGERRIKFMTTDKILFVEVLMPAVFRKPTSGLECGQIAFGHRKEMSLCKNPVYLHNNRPCNGLGWNATDKQIDNLILFHWTARDMIKVDDNNTQGVATWEVYVTCET